MRIGAQTVTDDGWRWRVSPESLKGRVTQWCSALLGHLYANPRPACKRVRLRLATDRIQFKSIPYLCGFKHPLLTQACSSTKLSHGLIQIHHGSSKFQVCQLRRRLGASLNLSLSSGYNLNLKEQPEVLRLRSLTQPRGRLGLTAGRLGRPT